ncbi:MAG TPA: phenylalanine--tRNA ligase subunit alpha [Methanomicrobiales archaeon]|nr:phenylalanine--tRNA ligase subunit alpha [Methanomicrobiales archaeon]
MDLTANEKRLLASLGKRRRADPAGLASDLGTTEEAVLQYARLLADRALVAIQKEVRKSYTLTDEGKEYREKGLPERQLLESFGESIPIKDLQRNPHAKLGIGWMRKKGWVTIRDGVVTKAGTPPPGPDENALRSPGSGGDGIRALVDRGLLTEREEAAYEILLTPAGEEALSAGLGTGEEVGTLTREQILSGSWKGLPLRKYRLETHPKPVIPGKVHPYQRLMSEMREILLDMGFTELSGGLVQSAFWNFDALFQPQDHPAREMQDTFYLDDCEPLPAGYERVKAAHENGAGTGSTGWGGTWSGAKAEQCVLRTHTTLLSIQHLAANPKPPVKAFCIGRVYRREAIDPTHLPEFEQLEGIVMDEGVNFTHLLGYLTEFYHRMGFSGVRFRPGYFPYTEPSVEPEVFVEGLGWVELGGAGIFREEVTRPWGIEHPVLAWGLGISRVAMLTLGLKDLRQLYRSDIAWIRESPVRRKA